LSDITLEEAKHNLLTMEMEISGSDPARPSKLDSLKIGKLHDTSEAYFTMPHLQPFMRCWMVDVCSLKSEMDADKPIDMSDIKLPEDVQRFTALAGGALYHSVRAFCDLTGLGTMSDQGGGISGWHIGYHCTTLEAHRLFNALNSKFDKAIKSGHIKLFCNPWSKRFA